MDMDSSNYVRLCGSMAARPQLSHRARGEEFYIFPLEVMRLSGIMDTLNIVVRRQMLEQTETGEGRLCVEGEVRTYNNRRGSGAKLVITVFAKSIEFTDEEDSNFVRLSGTICKAPKLRTTPMGRDICDLMVAVNRHYGRSDYLPCICWGTRARESAEWTVGTEIELEGRMQSRRYVKIGEDGAQERTAFEISAADVWLRNINTAFVEAVDGK